MIILCISGFAGAILAGNLGDCFLRDAQSAIPATVVDLFVNEVFVNFAIRQTNARSSIIYLEKIRLKAVSSRRWRSLLSEPNQEDVHGMYECRIPVARWVQSYILDESQITTNPCLCNIRAEGGSPRPWKTHPANAQRRMSPCKWRRFGTSIDLVRTYFRSFSRSSTFGVRLEWSFRGPSCKLAAFCIVLIISLNCSSVMSITLLSSVVVYGFFQERMRESDKIIEVR